MKITVNVQRKNKQGYYIGEDAVPYAADDMVIVADGLGGMGGFVHEEMDQAFFDEEKGVGMLLSVFPDAAKDGLVAEYVRKAFSDIFEEKRPRESAYFASRFAVTSMLYAIKEAKIFGVEKFLYPQTESDDQLADAIAEYLIGTMSKLAGAIGLDAKLISPNQYFLPTTLTMAVFGKREDGKLDVVTLNAGDSRTYCWSGEGLRVLTRDDVSESTAVMNNLVCLSVRFSLNIRRFVIDVPCAIFSASDGVHDSMAFQSNLYFESTLCGLIAECGEKKSSAVQQKSGKDEVDQGVMPSQIPAGEEVADRQEPLQDVAQSACVDEEQKKADACAAHIAEAYLQKYGCHDDGNTIAMALIGFRDFEDFVDTAEKRLAKIRSAHQEWDKYIGYRAVLRKMESAINRSMLVNLLNNYGDKIARVSSEATGGADQNAVRKAKNSCLKDFGIVESEDRVLSFEQLVESMMLCAYADYTPAELPSGFLSYDEIKKRSNMRAVSNYWYRNGARLVCESIAKVGTGAALDFDMSSLILPKMKDEIRDVYGNAYKVYSELSEMMSSYDKKYGELIK